MEKKGEAATRGNTSHLPPYYRILGEAARFGKGKKAPPQRERTPAVGRHRLDAIAVRSKGNNCASPNNIDSGKRAVELPSLIGCYLVRQWSRLKWKGHFVIERPQEFLGRYILTGGQMMHVGFQ
ncbi:MAG: hypothetical protein KatS3mg111_2782 [Pirellulaceae bacterium]|nr:MAG: hypothetical protein KatS3mg111_2782 [Pirellulaceae bacterium]